MPRPGARVTPAPTKAGAMRRKSASIRGVKRGFGKWMRMPAWRMAKMSSSNCATPETVTPQASAKPAFLTYGVRPSMNAIEKTLNRTGAAAAAAKRPIAFSTPENRAVRQTKNK